MLSVAAHTAVQARNDIDTTGHITRYASAARESSCCCREALQVQVKSGVVKAKYLQL
jgi:hypothetical protein